MGEALPGVFNECRHRRRRRSSRTSSSGALDRVLPLPDVIEERGLIDIRHSAGYAARRAPDHGAAYGRAIAGRVYRREGRGGGVSSEIIRPTTLGTSLFRASVALGSAGLMSRLAKSVRQSPCRHAMKSSLPQVLRLSRLALDAVGKRYRGRHPERPVCPHRRFVRRSNAANSCRSSGRAAAANRRCSTSSAVLIEDYDGAVRLDGERISRTASNKSRWCFKKNRRSRGARCSRTWRSDSRFGGVPKAERETSARRRRARTRRAARLRERGIRASSRAACVNAPHSRARCAPSRRSLLDGRTVRGARRANAFAAR